MPTDKGDITNTDPFIHVPAAVLSALSSLGHSLICSEMPIKVACFLLLPLFIGKETATTGTTLVGLCFVKMSYESGTRATNFIQSQRLARTRGIKGKIILTF